jgi:hypothetical protein
MEPTEAAVQWLRQGIPNVPQAETSIRGVKRQEAVSD